MKKKAKRKNCVISKMLKISDTYSTIPILNSWVSSKAKNTICEMAHKKSRNRLNESFSSVPVSCEFYRKIIIIKGS